MKIIFTFIGLLTLIATGCIKKPEKIPHGITEYHLTHNHRVRYYSLYIPANKPEVDHFPLVVVLHGGGGKAASIISSTGWTELAEKEGFLAVFPEGTRENEEPVNGFRSGGRTWNDGSERQNIHAVRANVDDVGFIEAMINEIAERFAVDRSKIYVTGFSNGASMTFRLGRELSAKIAAIAPVAGTDWLINRKPEAPVSLLYITGTADPLNPVNGGAVTLFGKDFGVKPSVEKMLMNWIADYPFEMEKISAEADNGVIKTRFLSPDSETEVLFYLISGQGHVWPGGKSHFPSWVVGKDTGKINATREIWKFFKKHSRRSVMNQDFL